MSEEKLKELGLSELIAPKGKFRSVMITDSIPYQIGSDSSSFMEAQQKCINAYRMFSNFYVYDDSGQTRPLVGLEYHIALHNALGRQSEVDSLQQTLDRTKHLRDAKRTEVRNLLKPHIEQALTEFETKHGTKISVSESGITPYEKGVALYVHLFNRSGSEFSEEFDNKLELEESITKRLRVILEEIFNKNGLPLTLGAITVPVYYWSK